MYDDSLEDLTAEFGLDTYGSRGLISSSDELHPDIYGAMPSSPTPLRTRAPYPKEHHSLLSEHTAYKPQNNNAVLGLPTRYQPNVQGYQRPLLFADPFSEMVDQDLEDGSQDIPSYKNPNRPPAPLPPVSARQNSATVTRPRGHNPRNAHSISLRPVSDLPDIYRTLFKFGVFNAVQSRCYDTAIYTDESMVISAPTGSGKTVLFELAIIRLLMSGASNAKCVYMAPTKALCMERFNDWTKKFQHIGVKCMLRNTKKLVTKLMHRVLSNPGCQLTGDTVDSGRNAWYEARDATIIVTTPEKWDSLTRNWHDHQEILSQMKLFLVDEVHILNESRGSTLEVCVSRMKTRGTSVRFVLLSATAPNIEDIAAWVGYSEGSVAESSTRMFKFGDEFRPCQITRHVYAYPRKQQNEYQFNRSLDFKVFELLMKHCGGKPALVFCPTRKGVTTAADTVMKQYKQQLDQKKNMPWPPPKLSAGSFQDKQLTSLASCGIGVHHAGLNLEDRRLTEEFFLSGQLQVVFATSTLAVGVNLPARTTIIKGTQMWGTAGWMEYSDLDIMQMIGRAGRPQFDKEGVAVIMCSSDMEHRYQTLSSGQTVIESNLHLNLTEHINSEIGLGTIRSLESAHHWLRNSFLFQRVKQNPVHYGKRIAESAEGGLSPSGSWQNRLDVLVDESLKSLVDLGVVESDKKGFRATEYGEIMSRYYIRYSTMKVILQLPEKATLKDILETMAQAAEFSDIRLRGNDKTVYNKIREHNDIRFRAGKIERTADKVMLLIQAVLGGISLNSAEFKTSDSQPALEALGVFKHACRIARAIVDVAIVRRSGSQIKFALELVRSLVAKAWDDRPIVLRQISHIGEKSIKVLTASGITNLSLLRSQDTFRLEALLNRKPPFGRDILAEIKTLPSYTISVAEDAVAPSGGSDPVMVTLTITAGLAAPLAPPKGAKKLRTNFLGFACILAVTSDLELIDFRRIPVKALQEPRSYTVSAELNKPSQTISVLISSENFAGLTVTTTYKPSLAANAYPTKNTRPQGLLEAELRDLENCEGLWNSDNDTEAGGQTEHYFKDPEIEDPVPQKNSRARTPAHSSVMRLPNGNFRCHHTCKDRARCRHVCCREGRAKPPGPSKRPSTKVRETSPSTTRKLQRDKTMQDLENLNSNTKFGMTAKGRLKIDAAKQPRRSRDETWLGFTQLGNEEEEEEELPELYELVKSKEPGEPIRQTSTDEFYDDSDFNAALESATPSTFFIEETSGINHTFFDSSQNNGESFSSPSMRERGNEEARLPKRRIQTNSSESPPMPKDKRHKVIQNVASIEGSKLPTDVFAAPSLTRERRVAPRKTLGQRSTKSSGPLFLSSSSQDPESPTDRKKLSEAPYAKNSRSPVRSLNQSQRSRELRDVAFTKPDPPNLKELEGDNLDPIFDFDEDTFDMQHNEGKDSQSTPKEIRPCSSDQQPEWTATPLSSRVIVPPSAPQADATSHSLNPTKGAPFKPPTSVTRRDPFHKPLLNDGQATTLTPVTSSFANQYDEFMDWVYNSGEVEIVGQD